MTRPVKASLLLFFFLICGSAFVITQRLERRSPAPVPRQLFAIVNEQLAAFRTADFQSAYRQAATGVQQKFTLAQFETMVRRNYPEMTRAHRVEFGVVKVQGASALVQVFFLAENGEARSFMYSLIDEDASWKIEGVQELRSNRRDQTLAGTHA